MRKTDLFIAAIHAGLKISRYNISFLSYTIVYTYHGYVKFLHDLANYKSIEIAKILKF